LVINFAFTTLTRDGPGSKAVGICDRRGHLLGLGCDR